MELKEKNNNFYKYREWSSLYIIQKHINFYIFSGKKTKANRIIFRALHEIEKKTKKDPLIVVTKAIFNLKTAFELKRIRKGAVTFEVPFPIYSKKKQIMAALRWVVLSVKEDKNKTAISSSLAKNLIEASEHRGKCIEKKTKFLKQVHMNRVYMFWRW